MGKHINELRRKASDNKELATRAKSLIKIIHIINLELVCERSSFWGRSDVEIIPSGRVGFLVRVGVSG